MEKLILLFYYAILLSSCQVKTPENSIKNYEKIQFNEKANLQTGNTCIGECEENLTIDLCDFMLGAQNVSVMSIENAEDIGKFNIINYQRCPQANLFHEVYATKYFANINYKIIDSVFSYENNNVMIYSPPLGISGEDVTKVYYLSSMRYVKNKAFILHQVRVSLDNQPLTDPNPQNLITISDLPTDRNQMHETLNDYYNNYEILCPHISIEFQEYFVESFDAYASNFQEECLY